MPRYFFHLYDDMIVLDEEGMELPGNDEAGRMALLNARSLAAATVLKGHLNLSHRIEVVDVRGEPVLTIPFSDAVKVQS